MAQDLDAAAEVLIQVMRDNARGMVAKRDLPGDLWLDTPWPNPKKPKEPMFFGAVQRKKAYVSVHLFPLYTHPELEAAMPPALVKHRHGKACLNFKDVEPAQLDELAALIKVSAGLFARPF